MKITDSFKLEYYKQPYDTYMGDTESRELKVALTMKGIVQNDPTIKLACITTRADGGQFKQNFTTNSDGTYSVILAKDIFLSEGGFIVDIQAEQSTVKKGLGGYVALVNRSAFATVISSPVVYKTLEELQALIAKASKDITTNQTANENLRTDLTNKVNEAVGKVDTAITKETNTNATLRTDLESKVTASINKETNTNNTLRLDLEDKVNAAISKETTSNKTLRDNLTSDVNAVVSQAQTDNTNLRNKLDKDVKDYIASADLKKTELTDTVNKLVNDTTNSANDLNTKLAQDVATYISGAKSDTTNYINNAQATQKEITDALNRYFADLQAKVDKGEINVVSSVDKKYMDDTVKKAVDDIQIGGRNYALGSAFPKWLSNNGATHPIIGEQVEDYYRVKNTNTVTNKGLNMYCGGLTVTIIDTALENQIFTSSVKIRANGNPKSVTFVVSLKFDDGTLQYNTTTTTTTTTTWNTVARIINPKDYNKKIVKVEFFITSNDDFTTDWLDIKQVKLELGNKPTDWVPAIEDLANSTAIDKKIKDSQDASKNYTDIEVKKISDNLATVKTTADKASSDISNLNSNFNSKVASYDSRNMTQRESYFYTIGTVKGISVGIGKSNAEYNMMVVEIVANGYNTKMPINTLVQLYKYQQPENSILNYYQYNLSEGIEASSYYVLDGESYLFFPITEQYISGVVSVRNMSGVYTSNPKVKVETTLPWDNPNVKYRINVGRYLTNINNGDFTSANILNKLLAVDGTGSGLDADKLDNIESTEFLRRYNAVDSTIPMNDLAMTTKSAEMYYMVVYNKTGYPYAHGSLYGYANASSYYGYCWQIFRGVSGEIYYRDAKQGASNETTTWNAWRELFNAKKLGDKPASDYALKSDIPSLTNYATKSYVSEEVTRAVTSGTVDLTGYLPTVDLKTELLKIDGSGSGLDADLLDGKDSTAFALKTDLTNLASKSDIPSLTNYALKTDIPSLSGYATTSSLSAYAKTTDLTAYAKTTDLSSYAKATDLANYVSSSSLTTTLGGYAKTADLSTYAKTADLSGYVKTSDTSYAKKTDIPSLTGYALKSDIPSLTNYATKTDITNMNKYWEGIDTRDTNELPSWYFTNHPKRTVFEFKQVSVMGLVGILTTTYCTVITVVPWNNTSGGLPVQYAMNGAGLGRVAYRASNDANTAWNAWQVLTKDATEILNDLKTVDGSGSGLDADLLDGVDGSLYARKTDIPSLTNYALKTDIPSLSGYATTSQLSSYATTASLSSYVTSTSLTSTLGSYAKTTDLSSYAKTTDLSAYAKTTDLSGYVKTTDTTYAKKTDIPTVPSLTPYLQTANLKTELLKIDGSGSTLDADLLDGVDGSLYARKTDIPSLSGYAKTSDLSGYALASDLAVLNNSMPSGIYNEQNKSATTMTTNDIWLDGTGKIGKIATVNKSTGAITFSPQMQLAKITQITQSAYDALSSKDANMLYLIIG